VGRNKILKRLGEKRGDAAIIFADMLLCMVATHIKIV
jgi:hypothetical protein